MAITAVGRGRRATSAVRRALETVISRVWSTGQELEAHGVEVARHVARGAIHAVEHAALDMGHLAGHALSAAVHALGRAGIDPSDALWGAGYGIVQGAAESGVDIGQAAAHAVEAAREADLPSGVSQENAVAHVARGVLDAAEALGPETLAQVRVRLPKEVLEADLTSPDQAQANQDKDRDEATDT